MRSGYNAVDELDFVAMQTFQANFFDIRSREWERFIEKNLGMRQGIITDPRYFDFISFAQMKTIQKFMRDPATVFEEVYGDETGAWKSRIVKRDAQLFPTPQSLLFAWQQRVGDVVLNRLLDTVQRPQPVPEPDVSTIRTGISDIYDYFQAGGFCLKVIVTNPAGSQRRSVCDVELVAPCTLWGARALRACRSIPNDYDVFCVNAFAKRCGVRISCDTLFSKTSIVNVSPCRKIVRGEK